MHTDGLNDILTIIECRLLETPYDRFTDNKEIDGLQKRSALAMCVVNHVHKLSIPRAYIWTRNSRNFFEQPRTHVRRRSDLQGSEGAIKGERLALGVQTVCFLPGYRPTRDLGPSEGRCGAEVGAAWPMETM